MPLIIFYTHIWSQLVWSLVKSSSRICWLLGLISLVILDTHIRTRKLWTRSVHHIGDIYAGRELHGKASKAEVPPYQETPSQMGDSGDNMVGNKSPLACLVGRYLFRWQSLRVWYELREPGDKQCPVTVCPVLQAVRVRWLGVTFSGPMPLVIDMTLTGPLNLGPETPTGRGNRWKLRQKLQLISLSLNLRTGWALYGAN